MSLLLACQNPVIDALTQRVRVLTLDQIARLLQIEFDEAESLVQQLEHARWVSVEPHLVSKIGDAEKPLVAWKPGDSPPEFSAVAYRLRRRWSEVQETQVVLPTAEACKRYGGTRIRPRRAEWTHDLWMSSVYLAYQRQLAGQTALVWISGDMLRSDGQAYQFGGRVPDACLCDSQGTIRRIVEGGGEGYSRSKLTGMHQEFSPYPYEIW